MDKRDILIIGIIITVGSTFLLFMILFTINQIFHQDKVDEACQELGLKKSIMAQFQRACLDYNGKSNLVDMKFTGLVVEKCKAEVFSIGDYRIIGVDYVG